MSGDEQEISGTGEEGELDNEQGEEGEVTTQAESPDVPLDESPIETVRRAQAEIKAKTEPTQDPQEESTSEEVAHDPKQDTEEAPREVLKQGEKDYSIKAPAFLSLEGKEAFNRAPKKVKKEFAKLLESQQRHFTERTTEISNKEKSYTGIEAVLNDYRPKWDMLGVAPEKILRGLAAAHDRLMTQPEEALAYLIKERGANLDKIHALLGIEGKAATTQARAAEVDIESHPKFRALTNTVTELQNERVQKQTQAQNAEVSSIQSEFEAVRDEVDSSGKYRYPEMHDGKFLDRMKPLLEGLVASRPDLSWRERAKRAHSILTDRSTGDTPQRLPANNQTQVAKAKASSVSIRGRGAQEGQFALESKDIPKRAADTVRLAMELNRARASQ